MLEGGFIVLQRKILSWDWYKDSNTKAVFLHLLLTANYEPGEWRGVKIKVGQRITSISKLSNELDLSFKEIRTALKHLQKTGEVACESTSQYTVITIKNYERYQKAESATASNAASSKAGKGQARGNKGTIITKQQINNKGAAASPKKGEPARRVPESLRDMFGDDYDAYEEWANQ